MRDYPTQHLDRRFEKQPFKCPACKDLNPKRQTVLAFQADAEMPRTDYEIGCEACGLVYGATVYLRGSGGPPPTSGAARELCPACDGSGVDEEGTCALCEGQQYIWASDFDDGAEMRGQEPLLKVQAYSSSSARMTWDGGKTWHDLGPITARTVEAREQTRSGRRKRAQQVRRGRRRAG